MFIYFYVKIATPPLNKINPSFPANNPLFSRKPPLKAEVLSSPPPLLKIWLEVQPPQQKGVGAHYD